jgi:hypothetical protein
MEAERERAGGLKVVEEKGAEVVPGAKRLFGS